VEITGDMVEERHRAIVKEVEGDGRATANTIMKMFSAIYNYIAPEDAPPNPTIRLKKRWLWHHVPAREGMVGGDRMAAFYRAVDSLENKVSRDYLLLLLFTGMRRAEAAGLTWHQVDLTAKMIRLPAAQTKAGRRLDLPMSDFVFTLLKKRKAIGDAGWVFPANSKSGHVESTQHPLRLVAKATGISVTAHDLRRDFASAAANAGVDLFTLKALLNHSIGRGITEGYVKIMIPQMLDGMQKATDRLKAWCRMP
jgi:integrase